MLQCTLVDDRGLGVYCLDGFSHSLRQIARGNLDQFRSGRLEFVQHRVLVLIASLGYELFIFRFLVWLHGTGILQMISIHPRRKWRGQITDEIRWREYQLAGAVLFHFGLLDLVGQHHQKGHDFKIIDASELALHGVCAARGEQAGNSAFLLFADN